MATGCTVPRSSTSWPSSVSVVTSPAVRSALDLPKEKLPKVPKHRPPSNGNGAAVDLLKVLLKMISETHGVASKIIATVDDLEAIAADDAAEVPALTGWRRELFGETASPLGRAIVSHGWLLRPAAVVAVVLELAAPVAPLGGRPRTVWVVLTWAMHLAIAALMFVVFPFPVSGVAFACFFRLEKAPSALGRLVAGTSTRRIGGRSEGWR